MPRKSLVASFLLLGLTLTPAFASAEECAGECARHQQVDAIFAPWSGKTTPGCAVGISRDGTLDYARGYGMSNLEYDVPITPQSIFHIASISKQ
jgi:CubicO group peptidase (beta-lactamase class C family)